MLIDYQQLSEEALIGVIDSYIQTNLSEVDTDIRIQDWRNSIMQKIKRGELFIEYSEINESVYLKSAEQLNL